MMEIVLYCRCECITVVWLLVVGDDDANGGELVLTRKRFGCVFVSITYLFHSQTNNGVIGEDASHMRLIALDRNVFG